MGKSQYSIVSERMMKRYCTLHCARVLDAVAGILLCSRSGLCICRSSTDETPFWRLRDRWIFTGDIGAADITAEICDGTVLFHVVLSLSPPTRHRA